MDHKQQITHDMAEERFRADMNETQRELTWGLAGKCVPQFFSYIAAQHIRELRG